MRFIRFVIAFLITFFSFGASAVYADIHDFYDITAEEIMSIADQKKDYCFQYIANDYKTKYPDEAATQSELTAVYAVRIHSMDGYDILTHQTGDDFYQMIKPSGEWLVLISRAGKSRFCLSVYFLDGEWHVGGMGFSDIYKIFDIPSEFMPGKDGRKYVRICSYDFIAIPGEKETMLMPVTDLPYLANLFPPDKKDSRGLYSVYDIMPDFVSIVRGCMEISPRIKVNGQIREVYQADIIQNISITATLDNYHGNSSNADWWFLAERNEELYYLSPSMQWVGNRTPVAQAPLQRIADFPVYSGTLPAGTYKLYFGVDLTQDGVINEPLFWTMTTVTVGE